VDSQDAARKWLSAGPIRFARRWRLSGNARDGLRAELRSLVPVAAVALAVVGVITARVGVRAGIGMVRRLS